MDKNKPLDHILAQFDELVRQETAELLQLMPQEIHLRNDHPRRHFDEAELRALADSIRNIGLLQPLVVQRRPDGRYVLIAGERRLRAAELAGLESVPAYVFPGSDEDVPAAALAENLSRSDLNPYERAEGILKLLEKTLRLDRGEILARIRAMGNALRKGKEDHESLHDEVGKNILATFDGLGYSLRTFAEKDVRIFSLPPEVLDLLRQGSVPYRTALLIARAPKELRSQLIEMAMGGATEAQIRTAVARTKKKRPATAQKYTRRLRAATQATADAEEVPPEVERLIDRLERLLSLTK